MQFGGRASEDESAAMYDACRAAGVVHFDTAHAYTDGDSERMLGQFAASERERVFIATKVSFPGGNSAESIRSSLDESRKRLGMEVVDLLYLHRFDPDAPLEESLATLAELREASHIRHIGVSNFAAWQVMKAQAIAAGLGIRIDVLQPMYNLVKRQAETEILPMCESESILPCTYSPLGGGLLTGKYATGGSGRLNEDDRYARRYGQEAMHAAAGGLASLASEREVDAATLAVAWVARRAVPILSARNAEQLAPSLAAMGFALDDALYAKLSALYPAPPPATDRLEEAG